MTPIETNKPLFFDTDGSPLEGGLIYIGQPSTDPRTNPKTVTFRDSGGSEFTAKQPLKTKAGRVVYNGLPIVALVDGEYSMLVINANGVEAEPYSRSVNAEGTSGGGIADFSEVTRVGLTLDETKAFDVSVGEVVRNIGKATATDGLGNEWLAVSATGSPGDDETLIDFTNGLQGQVVRPNYQEAIVDLGGDFATGSNVKITRSGSQVLITSVNFLSYVASTSSADSAPGVIPEWGRPSSTVTNIYYFLASGPAIYAITITAVGTVTTSTRRSDTGGAFTTTTPASPTISYAI